MSYLLDTNVLSELIRPKPNPNVVAWFKPLPAETLHVSVLTLGELRQGVENTVNSIRREKLRLWLETVVAGWFGNRVLPVDAAIADRWGRLIAATARPLPAVDSLVAATALVHGLRIVTRNVRDFNLPGVDVIDPWIATP